MLPRITIVLIVLAWANPAGAFVGFPGWREGTEHAVENRGLTLTLGEDSGRILAVDNRLTTESYELLEPLPLRLVVDGAPLGEEFELTARYLDADPTFVYHAGDLATSVTWRVRPDKDFVEKEISITNHGTCPVMLDEVTVFHFRLPSNAMMVHPHHDPSDAAWLINLFLRGERGGLYAGVENPFVELVRPTFWEFEFTYRPGWRLEPGATFVSEPGFLGTYAMQGIYAFKELHKLANMVRREIGRDYNNEARPLTMRIDQEVLDWGEVWAMQDFMQTIMPPQTFKKPGYYLRAIGPVDDVEESKTFAEMIAGIGHIAHIEWNTWFQLDDPGSPAIWIDSSGGELRLRPNEGWSEMVRHALEQGVYSGTMEGQPHPGYHARADWLRRARDGSYLHQSRALNGEFTRMSVCLANPAFFDWYAEQYDGLIREYDLYMLAWDDSGGYLRTKYYSGYECWAENHGHPPGDAAFYVWRNWMGFFRRMHELHPQLAMRVASGLQRGYPWILKDLIEHHTDFYDYGPGASWWRSVNYRFIPPYKCTSTMAAGTWDELHYNFFRSFSIAPQAMIWGVDVRYGWPGIPQTPEQHAFFRKWMAWADENIEYLRVRRDLFREPWGDKRLDAVHVDMEANFPWDDPQLHGTAHCIGDRGFLFIFNPAEMVRVAEIPLSDWIGLEAGAAYDLREIYPGEGVALGRYDRGASARIAVPADTVMLIEISPAGAGAAPGAPNLPADAPVDRAFYGWSEIPWGEIMAQP